MTSHSLDEKTTSDYTKYLSKNIITRGLCCLTFCLFILYLSIPTRQWTFPAETRISNIILFSRSQPVAQTEIQQEFGATITIWPQQAALHEHSKRNITIFVATKWYRLDFSGDTIKSQCSKDIQAWCSITASPDVSSTADAVLFHNRDFNQSLYPKNRNLSQVYVWLTSESPVHEKVDFLADQINWTMNYRRDADVHYPYVIVKKKDKPETLDSEAIWNMKNSSLTVAWLASNCNAGNKRKEIALKAIEEGLPIDIFGDCGKQLEKCGRHDPAPWACPIKLMKTYKFYLAFENSNCPDYVSEKLHKALNSYLAVPIVLQRKKYEDIGIPSTSFIAVDDFSSLKELASFINELKNDKQRYLEYHKWRETLIVDNIDDNSGFCDLCQKLRKGKHPQSYKNLQKWYSGETCDTETLFRYAQ